MEEDKRLKLPANWEAKIARLEWELEELEFKSAESGALLPGLGFWLHHLLDVSHSFSPFPHLYESSGPCVISYLLH